MPESYVLELGTVPYQEAWDIQRSLVDARIENTIPDTLILLQHPHTYTLGRSGDMANLLMNEAERAQKGVTVLEVNRGGDITYHGPGQLVIYPIRFLGIPDPSGLLPKVDYVGYIRQLEQVIIQTIGAYGLHGKRIEGLTGVWLDTPTGPEKIAAIGVHVNSKGVSSHGAALNVNPDLAFFDGIVPCGITDKGVTSLHKLLGDDAPTLTEVADQLKQAFSTVYGDTLQPATLAELLP